jgi:hypothetical protein
MSGVHHPGGRASASSVTSRPGACRRSRSSQRSPSPAPARSARRHDGSIASLSDPCAELLNCRFKPDPLQMAHAVRRQEHAGADLAERWRLLVDETRRPCAISAFAANRPPIPPPIIAT